MATNKQNKLHRQQLLGQVLVRQEFISIAYILQQYSYQSHGLAIQFPLLLEQ